MDKTPSVEKLEKKYAHLGLKFNPGYFTRSHPTQAFGEIDGMVFYFRFRHDFASLDIGKPFVYEGKSVDPTHPHYIINYAVKDNVTGDKYAGELSYEQEEELFSYLLENLREYKETPQRKEFRETMEAHMIDEIKNPKPENDWVKELMGE